MQNFWFEFYNWLLKFIGDPTAVFTFALFTVTLMLFLATRALVKSAERTARQQLQAYVFVESIFLADSSQFNALQNPEFKESAPTEPDRPGVYIVARNSGATPAYQTSFALDIAVEELRHEGTVKVPSGAPENAVLAPIAPHAVMTNYRWHAAVLTAQDKIDIAAGRKAIFAFGRIEYVDAFHKKRWITFKLRYSGDDYPPVEGRAANFAYCANGNDTEEAQH